MHTTDTIPPTTAMPARRSFLGKLAAAAGIAAVTGALPRSASAETFESSDPDFAPFDAALRKLTGTHREVFDAVSVNDGTGLVFAYVWSMTNRDAYKLSDKQLSPVLVARHFAIPIAMNDAMWAKYKFGEWLKVNDPVSNAPATRNLYTNMKGEELPFPDAALEKQQARGLTLFVCNVALHHGAAMAAKMANMQPDDVYNDWKANLVPGAIVAPSGVLAVGRAQERGCAYCYAG